MKIKNLTVLILIMLVLAGCIQTPLSETQTSSMSDKLPTNTPMYLTPLYRTYMFVGGGGWAANLDQTEIYYTRNFGEKSFCSNVNDPVFLSLKKRVKLSDS